MLAALCILKCEIAIYGLFSSAATQIVMYCTVLQYM